MSNFQQINTGPKYFGTAKKKSCFDYFDQTIPGPGTHNPQKISSSTAPEWKIGNDTNRHTFLDPHLKENPSPQHYKVNHKAIEKKSKHMSIPLSNYQPRRDSSGEFYNVNENQIKKGCPQFSFGYYQGNDYCTLPPGPGAYETLRQKISHNKGQNGFSTGLRPPPYGQSAKFPGPGKYSTIAFASKSKYSFGRASRDQHHSHDPPARFYDLSIKHKPFRVERQEDVQPNRKPSFIPKNEVPAPNAYRNELPNKIISGVMEKSNRTPIEHMAIISHPSPDKYTSQRAMQTKKSQSFAKQQRQLSPPIKMIPGPGAYQPMPTLSKRGGAMNKRKTDTDEPEYPGAATYHPNEMTVKKKATSTVMLRSQRTDFSKTITGKIGPGEYEIQKKNKKQGETVRIGTSNRQDYYSPNKNPGVGNYNLPNFIGKLPRYCTSPKKISDGGLSTFHEKVKKKLMEKQNMMRSLELTKKKSEQPSIVEGNPEQE